MGLRDHARLLMFVFHPVALYEFVPQRSADRDVGGHHVANSREFMEHDSPGMRFVQLGGI